MKPFSYLLTTFIILSCSSPSKTTSTASGKMYFPDKPVSIGINKIPDSLTQKFYNQLNEYKIKTISQQEAIELYKEEYTRSFNSITSANNNTSENFSNKLLSSMRPLYQVLGLNVNTETLGSGNINITGILWRSGLFPTVHADTTSHLYYPSDNVKGNNAKIVKEFIDSLLVSKVFR